MKKKLLLLLFLSLITIVSFGQNTHFDSLMIKILKSFPSNNITLLGVVKVTDTFKLPNILSKTDSTANKPIALDASGNVVKLDHWPIGAGSSGVALDAPQTVTTGSSLTVTNGNNIVIFNPATALSSMAFTFPATPHNGDYLNIFFGGTITSGLVINSITWIPNSGQSLNAAILPTTGFCGVPIIWKFNNNVWFLEEK